jgi:hypothetical protein
MKYVLITIALLCLIVPSSFAQNVEKENTVAVGINITNDETNNQQTNLSVYFRKYAFGADAGKIGAVYSQTFYDVTGVTLNPFNISHAQYIAKQAASVIIMKPKSWLTVFAFMDAGVLGTKDVSTTFVYGLGGYPEFNIKNKFFLDIMPKFSHNPITNNAVEIRFYGAIKF